MKAKAFFVVVSCLFILIVFANGWVSETDLTPHDPAVTAASYDNIAPLQAPVSGSPCYTPYIVQSGDTLSKIASACKVTLNELIAANPGLTNPNIIYPGQELRIPSGAQPGTNPLADAAATAAAQQAAAAPGWNPSGSAAGVLATGKQETVVSAAAAQAEQPAAAPGGAAPDVAAPDVAAPIVAAPIVIAPAAAAPVEAAPAAEVTAVPPSGEGAPAEIPGVKVGENFAVEMSGLPANAEFKLEYGTSSGRRLALGVGSSDSAGILRLAIVIPPEASPGQLWYVFAVPAAGGQEYQSEPIEIGGPPG